MGWFDGAEKLVTKVNEIHETFVETQTEFRLLKQQTENTLGEFKGALERLGAKVDTIQLDQAKAHAELHADIKGQEFRLNTLSEQALHVAIDRLARERIASAAKTPLLPAEGE